jgi:hypothetical protein
MVALLQQLLLPISAIVVAEPVAAAAGLELQNCFRCFGSNLDAAIHRSLLIHGNRHACHVV